MSNAEAALIPFFAFEYLLTVRFLKLSYYPLLPHLQRETYEPCESVSPSGSDVNETSNSLLQDTKMPLTDKGASVVDQHGCTWSEIPKLHECDWCTAG